MERVGEHPVPAGPLAVRWLAYDLPELRAGARAHARVLLRNEGSATWRSRNESGVQLSYHWLDDRGNAIVWDGPRRRLPASGRARRGGGGDGHGAGAAAAGPLPAGLRPRRGVQVLVRGDRLDAARGRRGRGAADRRAPPRGRRPRRRRRADDRRARRPRGGDRDLGRGRHGASRSGRAARAGLVAAGPRRARGGVRGGRGARSRAATGRSGHGLRAAAGIPRSSIRSCCPRCSRTLEPGEHDGLPAYVPDEEPAIFDGRIKLRLRRGRRRG